ncbi:MAG: carbohydrate kinase [Planctomycetota bacterium]|nr:MAG: carbohydrate kinase [Planctomycetota bacterium]
MYDLYALANTWDSRGETLAQRLVIAGFDGFVDEFISVVAERQSLDSFAAVADIPSFAAWVQAAAGRSSLKEIVVRQQDAGGCAVNLGDGLLGLGIPLDLYATLGNPIQAPFHSIVDRCRKVESWCSLPGRTLAFEFNDGKLMFPSVSQLGELDVAFLKQAIEQGDYRTSCQEAQLIAFTDWTLYPHMTACWSYLQEAVLAQCSHRPWIFIDLVDPRARAREDIAAMLRVLSGFQNHGRTVLGLNLNEAIAVGDVLGLGAAEDDDTSMPTLAAGIRSALDIEQVVIHAIHYAAMADANHTHAVPGPYCAAPKRSVGAGDRFNAGYCASLLLDLDPEACLLSGNASSGFFVRQARSASTQELAAFIRQWHDGACA